MNELGSVTKLLSDLQSDDRKVANRAAELLWERYCDRLLCEAVRNIALRIRQRVDEQDIVQNVFNSFFRRQANGEFALADREELTGLLIGMTRNKVLKEVRRHRADKRDTGREQGQGSEDLGGFEESTPAQDPTPEHLALASDLFERLMTQLDSTAQSLVLKRLEGYTHREIAEQLGCVVRTVERKIERIRAIIAQFEQEQ